MGDKKFKPQKGTKRSTLHQTCLPPGQLPLSFFFCFQRYSWLLISKSLYFTHTPCPGAFKLYTLLFSLHFPLDWMHSSFRVGSCFGYFMSHCGQDHSLFKLGCRFGRCMKRGLFSKEGRTWMTGMKLRVLDEV